MKTCRKLACATHKLSYVLDALLGALEDSLGAIASFSYHFVCLHRLVWSLIVQLKWQVDTVIYLFILGGAMLSQEVVKLHFELMLAFSFFKSLYDVELMLLWLHKACGLSSFTLLALLCGFSRQKIIHGFGLKRWIQVSLRWCPFSLEIVIYSLDAAQVLLNDTALIS